MSEAKTGIILVVGGAGYIGSALTGRLLEQGYRVRVLDVLLYRNGFALAAYRANPNFDFMQGDFRDSEILTRSLDGVGSVIMLAALVGDPLCRQHPELATAINATGTTELIERLAGKSLDRFIFMSTCSNYGLRRTEVEAVEKSELNPQSLYAETKVGVEQYLLDAVGRLGFPITILRCATAYGLSPRLRLDLTVNEFAYELAMGHELLVYDPDTWRPYCHVDDISAAIVRVIEAPTEMISGQVFNVGRSGENYTKRMLVDILKGYKADAKIRFREGAVDPRNYKVSFRKIAESLSFAGSRDVPGTFRELLSYFTGSGGLARPIDKSLYCNILS